MFVKRDKKSNNPGFNYQDQKKDSTAVDHKLGGGDDVGDVEGEKKEESVEGESNFETELEDVFG